MTTATGRAYPTRLHTATDAAAVTRGALGPVESGLERPNLDAMLVPVAPVSSEDVEPMPGPLQSLSLLFQEAVRECALGVVGRRAKIEDLPMMH